MTSDNGNVRWDQPLEAVSKKGEVVEVRFAVRQSDGDWDRQPNKIEPSLPGGISWFGDDGSHPTRAWTIRNKPAAAVASAPAEEWGPAIEVGGVRPAWLGDGVAVKWLSKSARWCKTSTTTLQWDDNIVAIRLPANHPHYRTEKPTEAPLGVLTGVEALEKLEALTRRLAAFYNEGSGRDAEIAAEAILWMRDANEIVRQMAPPVDPDLLKAREIACQNSRWDKESEPWRDVEQGKSDHIPMVRAALAGIKAGREMGK